MANDSIQRHLTARDEEILLALDRCPLTVQQLLKLSRSFRGSPFASPRSVQDRLQKLREAGWVNKWVYATAGRCGAPDYYKPTLLGYRLLYGRDALPPTRRAFAEVGLAHQHHTHCLAECIVHTLVAAHRVRVRMANFSREHTLQFALGGEFLFPDCAFELHTPLGQQFDFLVELDNGTERIRSDKDAESWQRKIRLYEQLQDERRPRRFRVLVVATRSRFRLHHILALAAASAPNPHRSLFYGVVLQDYLAEPNALYHPCFLDHRLAKVPLVPSPLSFHAHPPLRVPATMSPAPSRFATLPPLPPASRDLRRGSSPSDLPSPSS
jgi:hypothetical protein